MKWESDNYHYMVPSTVAQALSEENQISAWRNSEHSMTLNLILLKILKDAHPGSPESLLRLRVDTIKSKYWYFRIGEVAMILKNGLIGKYGNVPSGADPVLVWLDRYDTGERIGYCEAHNLSYKEPNERYFEEEEQKALIDAREAFKKQLAYMTAKEEAQKKLAQ
jgi:hypothetical protein